jgi:hypothetical protein
MPEIEKVIIGSLLGVLALIVPGFLFHVAPQFPGSFIGSLFGIASAILFLLLLIYSVVKRQPWIKDHFKKFLSLGTLLSFHVYAGTIGAFLGIIHSGHKFQSPLGITLVILMLIVVATGYIGRYYLVQIGVDLREQQKELSFLRNRYDNLAIAASNLENQSVVDPSGIPIGEIIGAISDREFSISAREMLQKAFKKWIVLHIVASIAMYVVLTLHIWSAIYFGLRWI